MTDRFRKKLLYLHYMNVLTNKQLLTWLRVDPGFEQPLSTPPAHIKLTPAQSLKLQKNLSAASYLEISAHLTHSNTSFITIFDSIYPDNLREIYDPPVILYMKGNVEYLRNEKMLAVVGSRKADQYTETMLNIILPDLLAEGICIISGLAKGADSIAHRLALKGQTIGVTGSGFQHVYPTSNQQLYKEMAAAQLLLSEYPPYIKPQKFHFPMRNRIIAGLSKGLLVTQAAVKSGTMITVDRALEEGRDIFSVPGSAVDPLSEGTNSLISQGAKLTVSAKDILNEWSI
ncbi:hypothetical protein KP77_18320 [Jeotgalibacillus alimentarius]|uniref:Smf/DprA SLOG domain-containing protein n=1 Tax=Jeotgalibacillus alimentarius TaxID=135826 RepID=A0A0C2VNG8_9BACL|nr:DNA-processing protein DprA [Jeotgalibacillus alimentarius]KIL50457.1 hypothetical protein KP77_18320 [Jeotgalibacillus alimentarius]